LLLFVISIDGLDPLRDKGITFWRMPVNAGVKAVGKVNLGLAHAVELLRMGLPEDNAAAVRDVKRFADGL
jgi:acetyl esterase